MAGPASISSSLTSTSHTLTAGPTAVVVAAKHSGRTMTSAPKPNGAAAASAAAGSSSSTGPPLFFLEQSQMYALLQPTAPLPNAALLDAKQALDAFAAQVGEERWRRMREAGRRKRKRGSEEIGGGGEKAQVARLHTLHVDGFDTYQAWQQAKRIARLALDQAAEVIEELELAGQVEEESVEEDEPRSEEEGDELEGSEMDEGGEEMEGFDEDDDIDEELNGDELENGVLDDDEDNEDGEDSEEDDDEANGPREYKQDPNGLNDGFFDLDDFNKQTQWLEDQDARGDPNTDLVSDDEGLDWVTDPFSKTASTSRPTKVKKSRKVDDEDPLATDEEEDSDDEEGGPTFGDMALDAPEGASDDESDGEGANSDDSGQNANDIFYKDFFLPPPKKASGKGKKRSAQRPAPDADSREVQRAMEDVRRDLFSDESSRSGGSDDDDDDAAALSDASAGDPRSRRSAHDRRAAKLLNEIRRLEAESVAQREWTMMGEATAADRPENAALEHDLDFEHAGKPLLVVTQDVVEDLEALIKRRIVAREFDEVVRRRPDADEEAGGGGAGSRRGLLADVGDIGARAKQSLAKVYEDEYVAATDPAGAKKASAADERVRKDEEGVAALWKDVSAQLDALSSWHYRPRPAAPAMTVVADVAAVQMEDAQPSTAQGMGGAQSRLAPQEVYRPGRDGGEPDKGEVLLEKSGVTYNKQEMSREDRARMRRQEKERRRKAAGNAGGGAKETNGAGAGAGAGANGKKKLSKTAQLRNDTVADLRKGGVKVINRKGEVVDMDGNRPKAARPVTSASFKL